jgi:hypothetical protein
MGKVFGIGLSKTATSSLTGALEVLGYRSIHFPFMSYDWGRLVLTPECVRNHDAFTDIPVANCFAYLDEKYPGSKFVYTVRDEDEWLQSCRKHYSRKHYGVRMAFNHFKWFHLQYSMYGCLSFDPDTFLAAYRRHDRAVKERFAGREEDLLILNICGGEGWDKLCDFLDEPVPSRPFPKSNVTEEKEWA